ncbi:polysaccharide lyase [Gilvimarinus chinensis]|uniref:polysaccharide lyase n=1 Tax=Gilvimarinus chinensis TaxID=396005 RepID=UPI000365BE17|nr:hypothetical protein [Gilvimarinus chinensis]
MFFNSIVASSFCWANEQAPIATFDFQDHNWLAQWNPPWHSRIHTTEIVHTPNAPGHSKSLLIHHPSGAVGPGEGGIQLPIVFADLDLLQPSYRELTLDYCLQFKEGFDFVKGGKLPGLMGANKSWTRSGGNQPNGRNGWTLRYMWREEGRAVVYAYLPPSPNGRYGATKWGQNIELGKSFIPGQWHCLKQRVILNDIGQENGELHIWFDGDKVLSRNDVSYRLQDSPAGFIGGIFISTFHGGNTPDWAPAQDSYLLLNDLRIFSVP